MGQRQWWWGRQVVADEEDMPAPPQPPPPHHPCPSPCLLFSPEEEADAKRGEGMERAHTHALPCQAERVNGLVGRKGAGSACSGAGGGGGRGTVQGPCPAQAPASSSHTQMITQALAWDQVRIRTEHHPPNDDE